jgi:hypothetical protein
MFLGRFAPMFLVRYISSKLVSIVNDVISGN